MEGIENMYEFQRWGLGLVISKNRVQDEFMYLSLTPNQVTVSQCCPVNLLQTENSVNSCDRLNHSSRVTVISQR